MKRIIIGIILLVLVMLGLYFLYRYDVINMPNGQNGISPTSTPTTTSSFQGEGALVRNNPGLTPGIWYLVTDQPGAPGLSYELSFTTGSTCTIGSAKVDCLNMSAENGQRVRVEGELRSGVVTVSTLRTVGGVEANIRITTPTPNQTVGSPIQITGEATGNWYFEASFPVTLRDARGITIAQTVAQAQGEWMTTDYVPFSVSLPYSVSVTTSATLVFQKDNPSGLPEFDKEYALPIILLPSKQAERTVTLYYYNPEKDKDAYGNILCSKQGLVPVTRKIPVTITPIQDTIRLLLKGNITAAEKAQGITTEYPLPGVVLTGASLANGVLTLSFADPANRTSGGACRAGILWFQIEATAKQFPGVTSVTFLPEDVFQP